MKTITSKLVEFAQFIALASVALFGMDSRSATVDPPWTLVGSRAPAILATIASHPASHTIYLGRIGGGLLKSRNVWATFDALSSLPTNEVMSMVMDPGNPNVVYADAYVNEAGNTGLPLRFKLICSAANRPRSARAQRLEC